ncbi:MAG: hypothetical protein GY790_19795 [Bacteroidetes bacterium]|nr:hypothetical protein [Bacteroidota bacterium]
MKIFLKTLCFALFLLGALPVMVRGQSVDHIYLKSGSVIRGDIIEIEPADHVKVQDLCGNIWYYKISEVDKITSEPFESGSREADQGGFGSGFVNMTSIGFLAGSSDNMQVAPFSLIMVNGWRSSFGLFLGGGVGVEFLRTNYLPMFIDMRYDLTGKDVVPYLLVKGGYSLPMASGYTESDVEYTYQGGLLAAAGVGLKIRTREHFAWDIELMYRYQQTSSSEVYSWNGQKYEYTDNYNRIEIRLGFYID